MPKKAQVKVEAKQSASAQQGKAAKQKSKTAKEPKELSPFQLWVRQPNDAALVELCEWVVSGGHLAGFVKKHGFVYVTVLKWINSDEERSKMYARAREDRADVLADEIVSISDEDCAVVDHPNGEDGAVEVVFDSVAVTRNKLRVDARKWAASKLKPRVYGDKLQTELTGKDGGPINVRASSVSDEELIKIIQAAKP